MDDIKRLLIESFKIVCLFSCLQFIHRSYVQGGVFPSNAWEKSLELQL